MRPRAEHAAFATVAPLLLQPVAASDVGRVLAQLAAGPAHGGIREPAGPDALLAPTTFDTWLATDATRTP